MLILAKYFTFYAKLLGKRFYCGALKGDSTYNICVNSDLTISCNCRDKYGFGKIGNIKSQVLSDIFSGEKANSFRKSLANGYFPILNCVGCSDLCWIDKKDADKYINDYKLPQGIMVENTVNCNLSCLSCDREQIYKNREKRSMSIDDIEHISKCIKQNDIKIISYFNFGEPFISKTVRQELEIIRKDNPKISINISTNGILLESKEKMEAAMLCDKIFFSIDGSTQESVCKYQRGGDFDKAYSNMKALVELRNSRKKKIPVIEWKYVLFRWNDSHELISRAIVLAKKAKVDLISFWPTLSPLFGISYRHYLGLGNLRNIGQPSRKRRVIDFRQEKFIRILSERNAATSSVASEVLKKHQH